MEWSSEKLVIDLPLLAKVELLPHILLFKLLVVVRRNFLLGLPMVDIATRRKKKTFELLCEKAKGKQATHSYRCYSVNCSADC